MTLIFSKLDPDIGLFAGSDILVSMKEQFGTAVDLPFKGRPIEHASQGYALAGLRQKTIIFGRTLVQWANRTDVSRDIIRRIFEVSEGGESQIELPEVIKAMGMPDSKSAEASIIYHYADEAEGAAGSIDRQARNCSWISSEPDNIVGEGSGAGQFFYDLTAEGGAQPNHPLSHLVAKVMAHALAESAGTTSLDDLYGGWFELATTARGAPGFRKISYATRFWMRRDGQLYGGPIVFGFYRGLTLYLLRLEPRQKTGKGRPGYDHHLQTVPDFLGREEEQLLSEAPIRPEVISHIVVEPGSPIQMQWIEGGDPSLHEMVLEVSAEGFRVEYSESLKKRLDALQPSERDVKLYYQFTGDPGAPR